MNPEVYRVKLADEVQKPDYQPHDGMTFCNFFVREVARWFDCTDFDDEGDWEKMASDYLDIMKKGGNWVEVGSEIGASAAQAGRLVVAGASAPEGEKHAHVVIVAPEKMSYSGSWDALVPAVANVGRTVFYGQRISMAFKAAQKKDVGYYLYGGQSV
jgi:hypothetical protein